MSFLDRLPSFTRRDVKADREATRGLSNRDQRYETRILGSVDEAHWFPAYPSATLKDLLDRPHVETVRLTMDTGFDAEWRAV